MALTTEQARPFFDYARERHAVYLRRAAGAPRPWTKDPILQQYRFTNVYRELDKTTDWFRRHVREPLRERPEVLLATVVFRMLNRIEVGEAVFNQIIMSERHGLTGFMYYLETGDLVALKRSIVSFCGKGPYVTGAYIISTPGGMSKLDGVMWIIDQFNKGNWRDWVNDTRVTGGRMGLQFTFDWLKEFPYLGHFHSYEIVTDLRHTALLDRAPDINTWANMGPGARRGLNRIHGRGKGEKGRGNWGAPISPAQALMEMRELLELSRNKELWPRHGGDLGWKGWRDHKIPPWEMREVEHTLCEYDKFERVRNGEGAPRGRFR